ncbi:hypothetical protein [Actinosynnema sp. NPDC020468]|uniref:hypothetical protein n=1 Tax=Actinosynnema sp. NPDC020468 TaxID=3154488 RepID=UPI0033D1AA52
MGQFPEPGDERSVRHPELHVDQRMPVGTPHPGTGSATKTLWWNDNTTSNWAWTSNPAQADGALVVITTGPVTAGTLAGATVTQQLVVTAETLGACTRPDGSHPPPVPVHLAVHPPVTTTAAQNTLVLIGFPSGLITGIPPRPPRLVKVVWFRRDRGG